MVGAWWKSAIFLVVSVPAEDNVEPVMMFWNREWERKCCLKDLITARGLTALQLEYEDKKASGVGSLPSTRLGTSKNWRDWTSCEC